MSTITNLVRYDVTDAQIQELRTKFASVSFDTPANYEEGRKAIATLRELRVAVEKKRKELKAESLNFGRRVDSVAKRLTELLEEIETPLLTEKKAVDDEKARAKAEKEAAERLALEEKIRAEREAEEARLRVIREAEEARLREENARLAAERAKLEAERKVQEAAQKAEQERLDAERRKLEAEQRAERERQEAAAKAEQERIAAERAKLEAERRSIAEEKERADRAEFERQAKIKAEAEAKAQAERFAKEAEAARVAELQRIEAERARLENLKPDITKVYAFAAALRAIRSPDLKSLEARAVVTSALGDIAAIAAGLEAFESDAQAAE